MGRQRRVHRPVQFDFPEDFPQRLERFKAAGGMTWRSLARRLGVSPHRLRQWRRGAAPDSAHLFLLLTLADRMGLRSMLMRPETDAPDGWTETVGPPCPWPVAEDREAYICASCTSLGVQVAVARRARLLRILRALVGSDVEPPVADNVHLTICLHPDATVRGEASA